jgi:hypothetical protein
LVRIRIVLVAGAVGLVFAGCTRDSLDWECPSLAAGDLVVTELRGEQSGDDTYGEWIELYNASGQAQDLHGAQLWIQRLDGGAEGRVIIRMPQVTVSAGGYLVLGRFPQADTPSHVDYGYQEDFDTDLYNGGAVDVMACGEQIDRVIYRDLPSRGTWALDGAIDPPDAVANDDETRWCQDDNEDSPDTTQLGIRGTPGEGNITCP